MDNNRCLNEAWASLAYVFSGTSHSLKDCVSIGLLVYQLILVSFGNSKHVLVRQVPYMRISFTNTFVNQFYILRNQITMSGTLYVIYLQSDAMYILI